MKNLGGFQQQPATANNNFNFSKEQQLTTELTMRKVLPATPELPEVTSRKRKNIKDHAAALPHSISEDPKDATFGAGMYGSEPRKVKNRAMSVM